MRRRSGAGRGGRGARDVSGRSVHRRTSRRAAPGRPRRSGTGALGVYTRPALRLAILLIELVAVLVLVDANAFAARDVDVTGLQRLSRQQVLAEAGLLGTRRMFLISPDLVEARLMSEPYIRSVAVDLVLPDRVRVQLVEWRPTAVLTRGRQQYLLNEEATVLGPAPASGPLPTLKVTQGQPGQPGVGQRVMSPALLTDLERIRVAFPSDYHLEVAYFEFGADQTLAAVTTGGPRILFGQMVTTEQIDSLESKLGALRALGAQVKLQGSCFDYVNVMNPLAPVTHCPSPSPAPSPSPQPSRKPTPAPHASPSPHH
jgi:cell division septal protein FtsQ